MLSRDWVLNWGTYRPSKTRAQLHSCIFLYDNGAKRMTWFQASPHQSTQRTFYMYMCLCYLQMIASPFHSVGNLTENTGMHLHVHVHFSISHQSCYVLIDVTLQHERGRADFPSLFLGSTFCCLNSLHADYAIARGSPYAEYFARALVVAMPSGKECDSYSLNEWRL